ncbi:50S ribosomal protein L21 [Candidatus Beckwithbacteria bacterium RBG_13_42_9]|uniref:Large ribosomal subunit protein bL21 n=1 Tax=Candidatus Beckwithbacteria bacterium RBG_13_42_9 TaxID=1797457 RepID=A0A1F5E7I0_9BACT|nr:MAG: 50S ribosomal protein L21 [Candidatus Beckwithbacteria bacterium RBG_13_42_9]
MDFAIFETGGKQYKVTSGQELEVEKLNLKPEDTIVFDKVLLVKFGEEVKVGQPYVAGAQVKAQIIGDKKGVKIRVARFRAKSRHRRVIGHRQTFTKIKVLEIEGIKAKKPAVKAIKSPAVKKAKTVKKAKK